MPQILCYLAGIIQGHFDHFKKGLFIKDVINQGGGLSYLISLFDKSDDDGGRGVKNLMKLMTSFMNGPKNCAEHP